MHVPQVKAGRSNYIEKAMEEAAKKMIKTPGVHDKVVTDVKKKKMRAEMLNGTRTATGKSYNRKPVAPRIALGQGASKRDQD